MAVIRKCKFASGVKSYHVQVRIRVFPPQTQTFKRTTLAKEWAALTETDIKAGRLLPRVIAERYSVSDLLTHYRKEVLPLKKATSPFKAGKDSAESKELPVKRDELIRWSVLCNTCKP